MRFDSISTDLKLGLFKVVCESPFKSHHTPEREAAFFIVSHWLPWTPDHESPCVRCHQTPRRPPPHTPHPAPLPLCTHQKQSCLRFWWGPAAIGFLSVAQLKTGRKKKEAWKLLLVKKQQKAIKSQLGSSFQSWLRGSMGRILKVNLSPFNYSDEKYTGYTLSLPVRQN